MSFGLKKVLAATYEVQSTLDEEIAESNQPMVENTPTAVVATQDPALDLAMHNNEASEPESTTHIPLENQWDNMSEEKIDFAYSDETKPSLMFGEDSLSLAQVKVSQEEKTTIDTLTKQNNEKNESVAMLKEKSVMKEKFVDTPTETNDATQGMAKPAESMQTITEEPEPEMAQQGLSSHRAEIVAAQEFIPVASENEEQKTFQKQYKLGDQNAIAINNVGRMIELHRQIRAYLVLATEKVFAKTFPDIYRSDIINLIRFQVRNYMKQNQGSSLQTIYNSDDPNASLSKIVNQAKSILNNLGGTGTNILKANIKLIQLDHLAKLSQQSPNPSGASQLESTELTEGYSGPIVSQASLNQARDIRTLLANKIKQGDDYLSLIYETFVYEQLVNSYSKYTARLTDLQNLITANYGIESNLINTSERLAAKSNLSSHATAFLAKGNLVGEQKDYFKNNLGIVRGENSSDTDVIYSLLLQLFSVLEFRDSSYTINNLSHADINKKILNENIEIGHSNDLSGDVRKLKSYKLINLIPDPFYSLGNPRSGQNDGTINSADFYNLFKTAFLKSNDSNREASDIYKSEDICTAESLAAMAFDFTVHTYNKTPTDQKLVFASNIQQSVDIANSTASLNVQNPYKNYIYKVLLGAQNFSKNSDLMSPQTNLIPADVLRSSVYNGMLSNILKIKQSAGTPIIDLESTEKVNMTYTPGGKYYQSKITPSMIDLVLGIDSENASDETKVATQAFADFTSEYYQTTISLIEDVASFFPDEVLADASNGSVTKASPAGKMTPKNRIVSLVNELIADLESILTDDSKKYLLTLFLASGTTEDSADRQFDCFQAMFWSFLSSRGYRQLIDNSRNAAALENSMPYDCVQYISQYYNDRLVKDFYEQDLNASMDSKFNQQTLTNTDGSEDSFSYETINAVNQSSSAVSSNISSVAGNLAIGVRLGSISGVTSNSSSTIISPQPGSSVDFDLALGGGVDFLKNTIGKTFDDVSASPNVGIYRLFENSFAAATANLDFSSAFENQPHNGILKNSRNGVFENSGIEVYGYIFDKNSADIPETTWQNGDTFDISSYASNRTGAYKPSSGPVELFMHHNAIIYFKWLKNLINKSLTVTCFTDNSAVNAAEYKIKSYDSQIRGLIAGLRRGCEELINLPNGLNAKAFSLKKAENIPNPSPNEVEFNHSYKLGIDGVLLPFNAINTRYKQAANICDVLLNHSSNMKKLTGRSGFIQQVLPQNNEEILALIALQNATSGNSSGNASKDYVKNNILLTSKVTPCTMLASARRNFNVKNTLLDKNLKFKLNKSKLMFSVLSSPEYGFLGSEKRGQKTILNIGIPSGMISALRKKAYKETNNPNFLNSDYVCVAVHKKNHLSENSVYCPKLFVFDSSADITDYNTLGDLSSHLANYAGGNIAAIKKSLEFIKSKIDTSSSEYIQTTTGLGTSLIPNQHVVENHLIDYCLKEYMQLTTGLDLNEETFLFGVDSLDIFENDRSFSADETSTVNAYNKILLTLSTVYPQVNEDRQLKNEVYRLTNIIKESFPFSAPKAFARCTGTRKFDRVYSVIINEKDFILKGLDNIFVGKTKRNIGSKLERPGEVDSKKLVSALNSNEDKVGNTSNTGEASEELNYAINETLGALFEENSTSLEVEINNYIDSLNNNFPEVYNYTVSLTMLPSNFDKLSSTTSNIESDTDNTVPQLLTVANNG